MGNLSWLCVLITSSETVFVTEGYMIIFESKSVDAGPGLLEL